MSHEKESLGADAAEGVTAGSIASDTATARHTPGPWMWTADDGDLVPEMPYTLYLHKLANGIEIIDDFVEPIVRSERGFYGPYGADRDLIAAAPEMYEALKAVLACATHHDENGHAYLRVPARSVNDLAFAIHVIAAKAEGRA